MNLSMNETNSEKIDMPGRTVYWLQKPSKTGGKYNSLCTVVYQPGERAKPAHAHDNGEEIIYVISGIGKVLVGDEVYALEPGMSVLFPQGVQHMVWNTGDVPLHLACFYGPSEEATTYTFDDSVDFEEFR